MTNLAPAEQIKQSGWGNHLLTSLARVLKVDTKK